MPSENESFKKKENKKNKQKTLKNRGCIANDKITDLAKRQVIQLTQNCFLSE